jgi:hypothetical protein
MNECEHLHVWVDNDPDMGHIVLCEDCGAEGIVTWRDDECG